ncbi:MAG TPA: hypothetical protein VKP88_08970 [Candidatus Paceibacterota bacterium]|nr:hypothetical protein [Candidatus Paceibacterota bacterium]
METIIYDVFVVWMMSAVALGVGASSLAISSFLVALNDGTIDTSEKRMLKVIYWALRSAMVMIPVTVLVVTFLKPGVLSGVTFIWILIAILYLNALQMTFHWIKGIVGPALQAASWYTLGFLLSIELFNLAPLTWTLFLILYAADIVFFYVLVKAVRAWQKCHAVQ